MYPVLFLCSKEELAAAVLGVVGFGFRIGDIRHNCADLSRIGKVLGYAPKWSFERGIAEFCAWVEAQKVQPDHCRASLEEMKRKGLLK